MTNMVIPAVKTCPKCGAPIPQIVDRRLVGDKIPRMIIGSVVALGGVAGLLLERFGGAVALPLIAFGLGTAYTHSFTAVLRSWRKNGKKS